LKKDWPKQKTTNRAICSGHYQAMKYKNKQIQSIKRKYGVESLYFFKGYGYHESKSGAISSTWPVIICSFKRNPKKVYKNHKNITVQARLTHAELDWVLSKFAKPHAYSPWGYHSTANNAQFSHIAVKSILFEPTNTEFEDLQSLKITYLITYLAGI